MYQGIQYVQGVRISVTQRSQNTIKAYNRYMFARDRQDRILNEPDDTNHEWSNPMDAIRYGFNGEAIPTKINRPTYKIGKRNYQ